MSSSWVPPSWAQINPTQSPISAMPQSSSGGGWGSDNLATAGVVLAAMGAVNSAIGGYFSAKSQRWQLKSQAKSLEFQKSISEINARIAESEATGIEIAGQKQASMMAMRYGAAQAAMRASMAARGIDQSVGSAAEAMASTEFAKQSDMATINANAVRAAEAQRMQAQNYRTQATMQGVSAHNIWASRRTISPEMEVAGSLMSSAGQIGGAYLNYSGVRMRRR